MEFYPYAITVLVAILLAQLYKITQQYLRERSVSVVTLVDLRHNPDALLTSVISVFLATLIVGNTTSLMSVLLLFILWLSLERVDWLSTKSALLVPVLIATIAALVSTVGEWGGSVALLDTAQAQERNSFLIWAIILLLVSEITVLSIRKSKLRKLPTSRRLIRSFRFSYTVPAVLSIGIATAQMQFNSTVLDSRFWYITASTSVVIATVIAYLYVYKRARLHLAEEALHFEKQQKLQKKQSKKSRKRKK